MKPSRILPLLLAAFLGSFAHAATAATTAAKPNIVLLFIDDMGYGDIGPFGGNFSDPPTQAEMQAFAAWSESLRAALIR